MKIQLDYNLKIITLDNTVSLQEFVDKLKEILPDWEGWILDTNQVITNWTNPIIIDRYPSAPPYIPNTPWYETYKITCDTDAAGNVTGTYNLQFDN